MFLPELWNVYDLTVNEESRTNNHAEAWHRRLSTLLGKSHPNIYQLLECFQKEDIFVKTRMIQTLNGQNNRRINATAISAGRRLKNICVDAPNRTPEEFLRAIAHNIKF